MLLLVILGVVLYQSLKNQAVHLSLEAMDVAMVTVP